MKEVNQRKQNQFKKGIHHLQYYCVRVTNNKFNRLKSAVFQALIKSFNTFQWLQFF